MTGGGGIGGSIFLFFDAGLSILSFSSNGTDKSGISCISLFLVRLFRHLTSETGKKFNGKTCVIVSTFDVTSGRVGVRIKNVRNKGRQLNIKPINLHDDQSTTLMEGVKETTPQEAEDKEDCPQEAEDVENCPICCDALPKLIYQFVRLSCCGKGLHKKCAKDL